jgi:hypothetical protein
MTVRYDTRDEFNGQQGNDQEVEMSDTSVSEWVPVKKFQQLHPEAGAINFIYEGARSGLFRSIKVSGKVLIAANALDLIYEEQQRSLAGGE